MGVGVRLERRLVQHFIQLLGRLRAVLVVLAEHGKRFGFVGRLGVFQMLEAIRLHLHDLVEIFFREHGVVRRPILVR